MFFYRISNCTANLYNSQQEFIYLQLLNITEVPKIFLFNAGYLIPVNISKISKRVKSLIEFQIKISDAKCTVTHPNCLIREPHHALWKKVVKAFKIEVDFQFTSSRLYLFIKFLLKVKMARPTGCEQKNIIICTVGKCVCLSYQTSQLWGENKKHVLQGFKHIWSVV